MRVKVEYRVYGVAVYTEDGYRLGGFTSLTEFRDLYPEAEIIASDEIRV